MIDALNGVKKGLSNLSDSLNKRTNLFGLDDLTNNTKGLLQTFGSPQVRDIARLLPVMTRLNVLIIGLTGAITAVAVVMKAMNEETRKFREISQRLAVINTTRNQGSQAELRQSTDLFAGLRRNSQILAELQIMGLTELNKNLINTAARLQLTGQSTEGFKKLTTTLLKFSSTTEGSLNRLSGDLVRISLQNGIKLDDLIDATMMTADSTRLAEFVGGAGGAQALAELKAQFAGLGGQLLGGQIAGFVDALADTPLGTLRTLGIEGSRDRLMRETDPSVQREIITQEIIPRLVRTFNVQAGDESTRTSNRFAVVQSLFGNLVGPTQDLINAFEKLGFITDDQTVNTSKLNSELERVATNTNAVADTMALNIERLTEQFDEAFAIRASDREEEVTEFDIAILSLTSSFRTLGTVIAPVGDFFVNMLAEISFSLAKFNLYVARLLTFDDDVENAITKQIDLIDKLDTLTDNDTLDQQQLMQAFDDIMAADPETEEGRRVIERNAQALRSLEETLSQLPTVASIGETTQRNLFLDAPTLSNSLDNLSASLSDFVQMSPSVQRSISDGISPEELREASIRLQEANILTDAGFSQAELSNMIDVLTRNQSDAAMQQVATALFVLSQQFLDQNTSDQLETLNQTLERLIRSNREAIEGAGASR